MSNPFDREKLSRIHQLMDELFAIQDANDGIGELPPAKQAEYDKLCDEHWLFHYLDTDLYSSSTKVI